MNTKNWLRVAVITAGLLMMGCSTTPTSAGLEPEATEATPVGQINNELARLLTERFDLLAPESFKKSKQLVGEANDLQNRAAEPAVLQAKVSESRMELKRTEQLAFAARASLSDVCEARENALRAEQRALASNVQDPDTIRAGFQKADDQFKSLTQALESNDTKKVADFRIEVLESFRRIEGKAVQKENLDGAKRVVERAKSAGAGSYASQTLITTEKTIKDAEAFINQNPRESDVAERGRAALTEAEHLMRITIESKKISDHRSEDIALWIDGHIARVETELEINAENAKGQPFSERFEAIQTGVADLNEEEVGLNLQIASSREPALIDEKVKSLEQLFSANDAQVLRQGGKVILRLKKVNFPVGKSTLPKSKVNDEIMAKVEAAIGVFPDAQLTIEGHTDSKGRMAANKKLSEKRAEAIRNYLIGHEVVTADEVSYVGKGANEPIESNSTAAGRATNRRIDIVIEPVRVLAE